MHRPAQRLTRILACAAAVPVMLVASGCSSSDSDGEKEASATPPARPSVAEAKFAKLPEACKTLGKKTLEDLVPEASDPKGDSGKSDNLAVRGACHWSSLDSNGVKGSQYRWLNVSLLRFESDQARGSGEKLAHGYFTKQVKSAQGAEDATDVTTEPVAGTGNEATAVSYRLKKKEGTFQQQTVVTRIENVVVSVDYNGAGLAGEKSPKADDLSKDTQRAAREAVDTVESANSDSGAGGSGSSSSDDSNGSDSDKSKDKGRKEG